MICLGLQVADKYDFHKEMIRHTFMPGGIGKAFHMINKRDLSHMTSTKYYDFFYSTLPHLVLLIILNPTENYPQDIKKRANYQRYAQLSGSPLECREPSLL